jgi:hypothetical protein
MARVDDFRREVDSCKQAAVVGLIGRQDLPTLEDVQRMEQAAASANVAVQSFPVLTPRLLFGFLQFFPQFTLLP